MINKKYLDKLKEEDYIHWDSVVNDPMVTGGNSSNIGFAIAAVFALVFFIGVGVLIGVLLSK